MKILRVYVAAAVSVSLAIAFAPPTHAETVYVIDKLLVGRPPGPKPDSAIIKVLPTGTKLEVVQRQGELALIEDPEGTRGWVDVAYLMDDAPARVLVDQLQAANKELKEKLDAGAAPGSSTQSRAEVDELTKENTELNENCRPKKSLRRN